MGKIIDFRNNQKNDDLESIDSYISPDALKVYVLVGIPAAGKTHYAKEFLNNPQTVIISSDEVRAKVTGSHKFFHESVDKVFDAVEQEVRQALSGGMNVVVDATNLRAKYRKKYIKIAREFNAYSIAIVFKTPLEVCLERNNKRKDFRKRIPTEVITKMSKTALVIYGFEEFYKVITVKP